MQSDTSFFTLPATIDRLLAKADRIITKIDSQEKRMSQVKEAIERLTREVAQEKEGVDQLLAYARSVPDIVRKAVEDALAANPSISAEDLAAITGAADELDRQQADIAAGLPPAPETPPQTEKGSQSL